jgi:hypothetical protein
MATRPPITKMPRRIEIQSGLGAADAIEPSIRMSIGGLLRQLSDLQAAVAELIANQNAGENETNYTTLNNTIIEMTNKSGSARNNGEVVIQYKSVDNAFTVTNLEGDAGVIGVVYTDSPDGSADAIEADAAGMVCIEGLANAYVDCTTYPITAGDWIKSSGLNGISIVADYETDEGVYALALEDKASGMGMIECFIMQRPNRRLFVRENVTASDAATVSVARNIYTDGTPQQTACYVWDAVNNVFTYPYADGVTLGNHARGRLTSNGKVITNINNDFDTGANSLFVYYMPSDRARYEEAGAVITMHMLTTGFTGVLGGVNPFTDFETQTKTIGGAINELNNIFWTTKHEINNALEYIGYDADGSITGLSGAILSTAAYTDAALTDLIYHEVNAYSVTTYGVLLMSCTYSAMNKDQSGARIVSEAITYSSGLIESILRDVTYTP